MHDKNPASDDPLKSGLRMNATRKYRELLLAASLITLPLSPHANPKLGEWVVREEAPRAPEDRFRYRQTPESASAPPIWSDDERKFRVKLSFDTAGPCGELAYFVIFHSERRDVDEANLGTDYFSVLQKARELYAAKCPEKQAVRYEYRYQRIDPQAANGSSYSIQVGYVSPTGVEILGTQESLALTRATSRLAASDRRFADYRFRYCDGIGQSNRSTEFPNARDVCEALAEWQPPTTASGEPQDMTKMVGGALPPDKLACRKLDDSRFPNGVHCYFHNYNYRWQIADQYGAKRNDIHLGVEFPTVFLFDSRKKFWVVHPSFRSLQLAWTREENQRRARENAENANRPESYNEWKARTTRERIESCQIENAFSYRYHLCR